NLEALAVAVAADLDFIRVEGFVFAHVGDEGLHQASAPSLIRKRAALAAKNIKIYADIKKKHSSHAITSDLSLTETAHAAEFFQADGIIVTGLRTGAAPPAEAVQEAIAAVNIPVLIGSGVTPQNMDLYSKADAVIVGSYAKYNGNWREAVDPERVKELSAAIRAALK
ncbi:MAG TPA: BtpA/SgcQ family protein, partial [Candidatus Obscuribacter sp.]|nr:BtpA/SgcQ family protein [Candidatus Obscuribacter sp.]